MKKIILCEIGIIAAAFLTFGFSDDLGTILFILAIVFPIASLIKAFGKDAKKIADKSKPNETEPVEETPKEPIYKSSYVFLRDTETIGNKFVRYFKEELQENDEFYRSNKDLKEEYLNEKIFQYEPLEIPYKIEGDQVFSYMKNDEWQFVGWIRESQMFLVQKSIETKLFLMPNTYKRVGDGYLQKESGDAYFGLLVKVEQ